MDDPERAPGDFKNAGLLGVPNGFLRLGRPCKAPLLHKRARGDSSINSFFRSFGPPGLPSGSLKAFAPKAQTPGGLALKGLISALRAL